VDALAYAHEHGVVHRDIKPDNILVARHHAMVTDFGVAKALSESTGRATITSMGVALGTPAYMAPEQASADPHIDHRADIYALGAMAYEMLTGAPPFSGLSPQAILAKQVTTSPEPVTSNRTTVPPALAVLVMRCLEKKPADRYQSAEELLQQLEVLATPSGGMTPTTAVPAVAPSGRRRWWIGGALLLAATVVALVVTRIRNSPQPAASAAPPDTSGMTVAVLPFESTGGGPDDEPFADGMTEQLMTTLGGIPGLRVAGRTSTFTFKGKNPEPKEVGEKLHVRLFTSGSVRRAGTALRVRIQLINVSDGLSRWSGNFDGDLKTAKDVFKVQDDIARSVATALGPQLGRQMAEAPAKRPTDDLQAYDLYLRGRFFWAQRRIADFPKAEQTFKAAIARDRKFAQAYAGLADLYAVWPSWVSGVDRRTDAEIYEAGTEAARTALRLDSALAEPHAALGYIKIYGEHDWAGAEAELKEALARAPHYATAHHWYAWVLMLTGRMSQAVDEARVAKDLEPLSALMVGYLGQRLYFAGRFDEALPNLRASLEMDPPPALAQQLRAFIVEALMLRGAPEEGLQNVLAPPPSGRSTDSLAAFPALAGWAYAVAGRRPEALKALAHFERLSEQGLVDSVPLAYLHAGLGDSVRASELLVKPMQGALMNLICDPALAVARRQPPMRKGMKQIGLDPDRVCRG
jgi:serine/threonine-protein kinase